MEFHRSGFKRGYTDLAILHAIDHAFAMIDLEPDAEPPKVLAIGPDPTGNLLEVIWVELDHKIELVIHAMTRRPKFYDLLPPGEDTRS